jgi:hypothetical protein
MLGDMTTLRWTRWLLSTPALARHLDEHPTRAVAMLDWLIWGGGGLA